MIQKELRNGECVIETANRSDSVRLYSTSFVPSDHMIRNKESDDASAKNKI